MSGTPPSVTPAAPAEELARDMAEAWRRGLRVAAESFLEQHPELRDPPEGALRLIYEEVCLRQECGEEVNVDDVLRRFPQWSTALEILLDCHQLVGASLASPQFPEVGEALGDFRLIGELGRGRHGRVFLATQPTLADRPVVLKVTPRQDREFLSLARLQHTHIIPLHSVYDFPKRNLRALCQPYLGGATLARVLELLEEIPVSRRTGLSLVEALDRTASASPRPLPARRGPRDALARASYVDAVCWIGACLADGLHYAHERGLVHLDLKPSNVLLAADGQPLLLDFHLAHHPLSAGQPAPEWFGGTPEYMSPEQAADCAAARLGQAVPEAVDQRSDIYSLGRMLAGMLGYDLVNASPLPAPVNRGNSEASVALTDLLKKCLAPRASERYRDAGTLATDLRRHLANQPLLGVPNRSFRERWQKWRRRQPDAPLWVGLLLALATAGTLLAASFLERVREAHGALTEGQSQLERGAFPEALRTLARGQARAQGLPGHGELAAAIEAQLRRARRAQAAADLHAVSESLRFFTGAEVYSPSELQTLETHCRTAWQARSLVAGREVASLDPATEDQIHADLLDLALLWAELKRRLALQQPRPDSAAEVQSILADAEKLLGPEPALLREHRGSGADGREAPESAARPVAWEQMALGHSLLRSGQLDLAAEALDRATDLRPQDFWAHFYRAVCAFRREQYAEAVHSFGVAIALAPTCAEVYYNRGLAYASWGDADHAFRDYDRALTLAPLLASAALNRGVLHYRQGRHALARTDLEHALKHGAEPATTHFNLALVHVATADEAEARHHLERALAHNPKHSEALLLRDRLQTSRP